MWKKLCFGKPVSKGPDSCGKHVWGEQIHVEKMSSRDQTYADKLPLRDKIQRKNVHVTHIADP